MRLQFTSEDQRFREEVREFLAAELPQATAQAEAGRSHLERAECAQWHGILYQKGWAAPGWPKVNGGTGWSVTQRYIFDVEYGVANAPEISVIALQLVGPLICRFGSDEQKARLLEPILRGDILFCQGFSEPQAGSDLANVRTRAVRDGDMFVLNGQKTWTSHARDADYMICLARTNAEVKPQQGLSLFVVPMDAPGITVRPIATIDGRSSVNEVFIDNVAVDLANCVGEPDKAWSYTKFVLDNERTHNAHIGVLKRYLHRIQHLLDADRQTPQVLSRYRDRYLRLEIDICALEWSVLRVIASPDAGQALASALKVKGSELLMRAAELELDILGPAVLGALPEHNVSSSDVDGASESGKMSQYLYWRASTIFGGSNEIQRSIIWSAMFR
jgi:alkylation response protein AidB-like acyl-CoA dehydrogenase